MLFGNSITKIFITGGAGGAGFIGSHAACQTIFNASELDRIISII